MRRDRGWLGPQSLVVATKQFPKKDRRRRRLDFLPANYSIGPYIARCASSLSRPSSPHPCHPAAPGSVVRLRYCARCREPWERSVLRAPCWGPQYRPQLVPKSTPIKPPRRIQPCATLDCNRWFIVPIPGFISQNVSRPGVALKSACSKMPICHHANSRRSSSCSVR
jgi:hypothetical protein